MKIHLIQPRHLYAEPDGIGHIYMPGSILAAGARLIAAGVSVEFSDENLEKVTPKCENIGLSLLGPPYIWKAVEMLQHYRQSLPDNTKYFLGGQVVSGLTKDQFEKLFHSNVYNGNNDNELAENLGFDQTLLPDTENVSLIPMYEKIPDTIMFEYLSREFSLYISQGCKFNCSFCSAVRTTVDPISKKIIRRKEVYRNFSILEADLNYLINRAMSLNISTLNIYMSNLDVFQTPSDLDKFADICNKLLCEYPGFKLNLRGLATVDSFLYMHRKYPATITKLVNVGFHSVGFGIDGMTPVVWKLIKKNHNSEDKCIQAIQISRTEYNITPEMLMVFGHEGADTEDSLKAAYDFTLSMVDKYNAVPRPHISKSFIPGNEGWFSDHFKEKVDTLIQNPFLFQSLDFTALPTELTHSDDIRDLATEYFLKICSIKGNTTQWIIPYTSRMTSSELATAKKSNLNKFDR